MKYNLKVIRKKSFLKYGNEVIDINVPMDFFIIMDEMKQEINSKLEFCETDHDKTVSDIIYDEKL